jgi:GNAT superfamily N-acetyltransferase
VIRPLSIEDMDDAVEMGAHHFIECRMSGLFNKETMKKALVDGIENGTAIVLGAYEKELIGYIWGMTFPHFYTGDMECMAMSWYVKPSHRGGTEAFRLLKEFEKVAKERKCRRIYVGCMVGDSLKKFARVFTRNGYRIYEAHFLKEV